MSSQPPLESRHLLFSRIGVIGVAAVIAQQCLLVFMAGAMDGGTALSCCLAVAFLASFFMVAANWAIGSRAFLGVSLGGLGMLLGDLLAPPVSLTAAHCSMCSNQGGVTASMALMILFCSAGCLLKCEDTEHTLFRRAIRVTTCIAFMAAGMVAAAGVLETQFPPWRVSWPVAHWVMMAGMLVGTLVAELLLVNGASLVRFLVPFRFVRPVTSRTF